MALHPTAILLLALYLAAMVLLVFASISVPTWFSVSFLNVGPSGPDQLRYGIFGYTQNQINHVSLGYLFTLDIANRRNGQNLTKALILHPIAAGLSGLAFLTAWFGIHPKKNYSTVINVATFLAFTATNQAFIFDLTLFLRARNKYREAGDTAELGNGFWITLGADVSLLVAFIVFCHRRTYKPIK